MNDENRTPLNSTREPQYQRSLDLSQERGLTTLGLMTNQAWTDDPRHLLFTLARYKFVAKMLTGKNRVLEVGCADAFGTRLVVDRKSEERRVGKECRSRW